MIVLLDIDGTLVDTNYHHAIAWYRAFRAHAITLPIWQIHRHIGMGGDQFVPALTDDATDARIGDAVRTEHDEQYAQLIGEVTTMHGSHALIEDLLRRGHRIVFASSAQADEAEHYIDLLESRDLAEAWTTSADVESTKPAPDLVHAALAKVHGDPENAVLIGDTPWDVEAAAQAKVPTLAVLTGGFSVEELRDAGAAGVYESVEDLRLRLDETDLR